MGAFSLLLRITTLAGVALLGACAADRDPVMSDPSFYQNLTTTDAKVDAKMAASMISGYRANNGQTAVTVDPALMKMAEEQARAMAARDKLDHSVTRDFNDRLRAKGYNARAAAENISAGYHTLAEAFSGWRDSPPHRQNMLPQRCDPDRHCRRAGAEVQVQGVLGADHRPAGRRARLTRTESCSLG